MYIYIYICIYICIYVYMQMYTYMYIYITYLKLCLDFPDCRAEDPGAVQSDVPST